MPCLRIDTCAVVNVLNFKLASSDESADSSDEVSPLALPLSLPHSLSDNSPHVHSLSLLDEIERMKHAMINSAFQKSQLQELDSKTKSLQSCRQMVPCLQDQHPTIKLLHLLCHSISTIDFRLASPLPNIRKQKMQHRKGHVRIVSRQHCKHLDAYRILRAHNLS